MGLLFLLTLLALGYFCGQHFEKKHYEDIIRREKRYRNIPVISGEWKTVITDDETAELFQGEIVVASDYFKTFVSAIRNIFGGRLTAYESLLDRGRREAILRLKEKASKWGAERIINLRVETSSVGRSSTNSRGRGLPCMELFAYATGVKTKKQ